MIEQSLKVHFINQDARAYFRRHLTDLSQGVVIGEGAARIVQIAEHDETRLRSDPTFELS